MELITKTLQVTQITQKEFDIDGSNSETITAKTTINCTNGKVTVKINTPPTAEAVGGTRRERLNKLRAMISDHATSEGYEVASSYGFDRVEDAPDLFDPKNQPQEPQPAATN